jgi:hypothetical protein
MVAEGGRWAVGKATVAAGKQSCASGAVGEVGAADLPDASVKVKVHSPDVGADRGLNVTVVAVAEAHASVDGGEATCRKPVCGTSMV